MYVLVNGAFGIGKTTVARQLCQLVPGSVLFDPEWIGFVLRRLPGYRRSDFQHLASWRRLTVLGARGFGTVRPTVVVPMAFSELRYLDEVRSALSSRGRFVLHFCLTASLEVVQQRLAMRGEPAHDPRWAWVHRRAAECCAAHRSERFAVHVPTDRAEPSAIAGQLAERVLYAARGRNATTC